jgi:Outer membrane protein beta-barrel domain
MKIQGTFMTVALLAAAAVPAAAQSVPKFSLEPAAYYATVSGDDFEGVDAGMGFDVQGRVKFTALSLGLGWQRSSHGNDFVDENINSSGFFVEPRYEIPSAASIKPYIGARLARVTQSLEAEGSELKSSGFAYGAGVGIIMPLAGTVKLNTSANYNRVSYGNAEVDGSEIQDTDLSGSSLVLRVGVSLSFGR